jgi:exodeoxyribonuclease VII small subunit
MAPPKKKDSAFNFEQGMNQLEQIISSMESGELPLDQVLDHYEKGMTLVAQCEEKLKVAEQQVELIVQTRNSTPKKESFSSLEPQDSSANSETQGDGGEVRLF